MTADAQRRLKTLVCKATLVSADPKVQGEVTYDATIDVTGNMLVDNTANGLGKLAFELESGDLLSMINVTGNAT